MFNIRTKKNNLTLRGQKVNAILLIQAKAKNGKMKTGVNYPMKKKELEYRPAHFEKNSLGRARETNTFLNLALAWLF